MLKIVAAILASVSMATCAGATCISEFRNGTASLTCSGDEVEQQCSFTWPLRNEAGMLMGWTGFFIIPEGDGKREMVNLKLLGGSPISASAGPAKIDCRVAGGPYVAQHP